MTDFDNSSTQLFITVHTISNGYLNAFGEDYKMMELLSEFLSLTIVMTKLQGLDVSPGLCRKQ